MSCPAMEGIQVANPLTSHEGASQAPFRHADLQSAMSDEGSGVYTASSNFFWHDVRQLPVPGVPVNQKGVMDLKTHHLYVARVIGFHRDYSI